MKWITRARPKTDRIACPWLIRRFIDPDAEVLYVPNDQVLDVARDEHAHSFDASGAEFDHRDGRCTFEVLIDHFDLDRDPALVRLAAGFGGGDGGGGHQLGDLADGVGAQVVVGEVLGHVAPAATCWAHHA